MKLKSIALVLSLFFALAALAWPGAASPAQVIGQTCKCCPHVNVFTDPDCDCTIQLQNEVIRIGRCAIGNCLTGGNTCGNQTQACKLTATAVEVGTGCTGSEDINILANCGQDPEETIETLPCSAGGGNDHIIQLVCDDCTCPSVSCQ